MGVIIRGISSIIKFMALGSMSGVRIGGMRGNGNIIKCMALAPFNGPMGGSMLGIMKMIKNMDMELSIGRMGGSTQVSGKMENNMVGESIIFKMVKRRLGNGFRVKELDGLKKQKNKINKIELKHFSIDMFILFLYLHNS